MSIVEQAHYQTVPLQSRILERALTFAVNNPAELSFSAYSLSVNDTFVVARPRDSGRLANLDIFSRNAAIQLGETLANVQLGIQQHGYGSTIELLPIKNRIDPLAMIRLGAPVVPESALQLMPTKGSELNRYEPTLGMRAASIQILARLDLVAQATGVWAQALAALEALPESQTRSRAIPDLAMLGLAPESTLLAIYAEGNSLLDWLQVGQAIARMKKVARDQNMGVRQLNADMTMHVRSQVPWRHTLQFTQLQALVQVGPLDASLS